MWTIELPDAASLAGAADSLERGGYAIERAAAAGTPPAVAASDPWGTGLTLRAAPGGAGPD